MSLTKFKSRILSVSLSTANPTKRQATTIINRDTQSKSTSSPPPNASEQSNGQRSPTPSDHSSDSTTNHPTKASIQSRTLALLNIPDTINSARIRNLMEPYGALVKIVLRPDHQGAIVEYADTKDAGKAALGIEGYEIVPGRTIRVGTVKELRGTKEEVKPKKGVFGSSKEKQKDKTVGGFASSGIVNRPTLGAGGRRGGLGRKRGFGGFIPRTRTAREEKEDEDEKGSRKEEKMEEQGDTKMGDYADAEDCYNEEDKNNDNGPAAAERAEEGERATEGNIKEGDNDNNDNDNNIDQEKEEPRSKAKPKGKSNADFKALFLGSREK